MLLIKMHLTQDDMHMLLIKMHLTLHYIIIIIIIMKAFLKRRLSG